VSEVSFISSGLAAATRSSRAPEKSAAKEAQAPAREKSAPPPDTALAHKTKVKTEQLSKYSFGYTFLDPETLRVVGQYPAAPPIGGYRK